MKLAGMQHHELNDVVDAVVIGTGAGGAPLLARLAGRGLKIVALEAGRNWEEPADFSTDESAQSKLYWLDERLSAGADAGAFGGNNSGTGLGGSTLHYGAFVPRADPRDLRVHSDFGVGADWPVTRAELDPYYDEVERFIGVAGPASYPWDAKRKYELPPVPLNAPALLMRKGCASVGLRTSEAPVAALTAPLEREGQPRRHLCSNRGYCHQGCTEGAKSTMDVTYLPWALRRGAELRTGARVHSLERDAQGQVTAVVYRQGSEDFRQRCRAVFLCAGGIESPRLLLHWGVGNANGQVGQNYLVHVATQAWGTFDVETRPSRGFPASLITEDTLRPEGASFAGGYLIQSLGIVPATWGEQVARGRKLSGLALTSYLRSYNHVAGIGINGECLPAPGNRVTLSEETDATGMKKPLVTYSMGENEQRLRAHAEQTLRRIWNAAGAKDLWVFNRTAHTLGTCRMGVDPELNVVDGVGRSHEVPGLWICDNSTFPSALAANPALTQMALALRTADAFCAPAPATAA